MRRQISMQEANDKIFEICDQYKVPIVQYKENDIPDGRQNSDDIISINRQMGFNFDQDAPGYFVYDLPWVRCMTTLDEEEFNDLLIHGKHVQDCVRDLNEFLNSVLIIEKEDY